MAFFGLGPVFPGRTLTFRRIYITNIIVYSIPRLKIFHIFGIFLDQCARLARRIVLTI